MKRLVVFLVIAAALSLAGCGEGKERPVVVVHAAWEIVYPDTTIRYEEDLRLSPYFSKTMTAPYTLTVYSDRGTSYLEAYDGNRHNLYIGVPKGSPKSSTCPIRVVEYHMVEEVPGQ